MQKKLIALAVAGLVSTGAMAQVTLYGVADGTFDMVKSSGAVNPANNVSNFNRVSANSSLFGLRGDEDLGGGMKAQFQFESSISLDSTGGTLAVRDSFVGLTGGFGTVRLGNLTGPTRLAGAVTDVNAGATGIGANAALIGKLDQGHGTNNADSTVTTNAPCGTRSSTCASLFDNRWKNAVAYVSPSFSGLTVTGVVVANENRNAAGTLNTKGYDFGVRYNAGPVDAALTRNWGTIGDAAKTETSLTRLVGKFNFGMGDVRALYDMVEGEDNTGKSERNIFGLGATFNVGSGKVIGQYYSSGDREDAGTKVADTGASMVALGYEHSLGKRTIVKAVFSRVANDDAANFDFGVNATGVATNGSTVQGVSVGLRHTF